MLKLQNPELIRAALEGDFPGSTQEPVEAPESEGSRTGAAVDQLQYLSWRALETFGDLLNVESIQKLAGEGAKINKEQLAEYERIAFKDVENVSDFNKWFLDNLIINAGSMVPAVAAGAVAGVAGAPAWIAAGAAFIPSAILGIGESYSKQLQAEGNIDPLVATMTGLTVGALDVLTPKKVLNTLGVGKGFNAYMTTQLAKRGKIANRVMAGVGGMLREGSTETLQETIMTMAKNYVNDQKLTDFSQEEIDDLFESWASGMAVGGTISAVLPAADAEGRAVAGRKKEAIAEVQAELEASLAEGNRWANRRKNKALRQKIDKIKKASTIEEIDELFPAPKEEAEVVEEETAAPEKTLAQIMAEDPRTAEAERRQQPDEVLPEGTERGVTPTQEQIDARIRREAAQRAERGTQQEAYPDPSVLEDTIPTEPFADPSVLEDTIPPTTPGPQSRTRKIIADRADQAPTTPGPQERSRKPILDTPIEGDVMTEGEVLILRQDIEEAKFAKASRELEDDASRAYNEAYDEAVLESGGDYFQAAEAGEEARLRVLREGGATRRRVYPNPAARRQAEQKAAEERRKREAEANLAAQRRIDEQKKFEKEQAVELKEQAINMADDLIDAFMLGEISGQEFITRRQAEIASIQDGIGGTAAANAYKKIATIARVNAILKERGLPTLKTEGEKPTQAEVTPPAPEAAPTPTQADVTPPAPEAAPEAAPTPEPTPEAAPDVTETEKIPGTLDATKYPDFDAYMEDMSDLGFSPDEMKEQGWPHDEESFAAYKAEQEAAAAEAKPAEAPKEEVKPEEAPVTEDVAKEDKAPTRRVPVADEEGAQAVARETVKAEGAPTVPVTETVEPDVEVTREEDETTAPPPDEEVATDVAADIEAATTGVDITGEAVDVPAAPTPAEVVIDEPVPAEPEVLEYAETTVNPDGVPIRIYEDPDTPGLNIVESEGVVLKRSKDRAKAVTYANTKVTPETVLRKTPKVKAAPKARPEGKTYTGPKPKGASESLVKWLGSDAPFRATIGKQRASQARKVGLDPDQYTTEEELYDAIVAQAEAQPVEAPEVAPVAEEVQEVAEEIVPETILERLSREISVEEANEKNEARAKRYELTGQELEEVQRQAEELGLMEDVDSSVDAEEAKLIAEENKHKAAAAAEKDRVRADPDLVRQMEYNDLFMLLKNPPNRGGYSMKQLQALAKNIKEVDPTFKPKSLKKKEDISLALLDWHQKGYVAPEVTESGYIDEYDSDNDVIDTFVDQEYNEARREEGIEVVTPTEVRNIINTQIKTIFGVAKAQELIDIGFINIVDSAEANKEGIRKESIAAYNNTKVKAFFIPDRIANRITGVDPDRYIRGLIMHEIGVHAGKNVFSGAEFELVLNEVKRLNEQGDSLVVDSVNTVGREYPDLNATDSKFWEEVLAHVIETKSYDIPQINPSFFEKLVTAFKDFFNRIFYDVRADGTVETLPITEPGNITVDDIFNVVAGHGMRNIHTWAVKNVDDSPSMVKMRTNARDKFIENSEVKHTVFHGGDFNWSAPLLDKTEFGLHVGTEKAALARVNNQDYKVSEGYIKVENPFYSEDLNFWESWSQWLKGLNYQYEKDFIDHATYSKLLQVVAEHKAAYNQLVSVGSPTMADKKQALQKQFAEDMRDALMELGYDSIAYTNMAEDIGSTSYILLGDNQFKDVKSLKFSSGTNVFDDKRSAQASPLEEVELSKKVGDIAEEQNSTTRKAQGMIFNAAKKVQRAIEPLMTIKGYNELETQRMLAKGEIGKWHNYGRVVFDVLYQANAKEKKAILKYFETRGASPDDLPTRKVPVAKLPTVARGTRAEGRMAENRSIRDVAVQAKKEIEQLGANLVRAGLITEEQYKKWQGQYLPKTYLKYIEKDRIARGIGTSRMTYTKVRSAHENFLKDVMEGRIEDPAFLAGRYISMAGADLATINYLQFLAADTGKNGWVLPNQTITYEGMTGTAGYWNEYVNEMRNNIARMRELNPDKAKEMERIADQIQKKLDNVGDMPSAEGYKKVPDNVRYGAMRGLYVKKEIINDVMGLESLYTNNEFLNKALSFSGKTTKVFKYTKVPMNIPTQARNIISNIVLMDTSGTNFLRIPGLLSRAITDIVQDGKYAQLARQYGIESTTFAAEELVNMDRELLKLKAEKDSWSGMWAKSKIFFNDYLDVGGRAYQKTEVMFKVAKMIDLMENHGKSEAEAARLANEALLDYSNVSQGVRVIRSMPLGSPFITFNLKAGTQMIRNMREHPLAVAKYAAIPYVVAQMLMDNNDDIDEEDVSAMKKLVADYMEGNLTTMVLPWKDDEGRYRVFDMGYFLPWGAHLSLGQNLWKGEFGKAAAIPGFAGGPVQVITGLNTNVDPFTKQEIWNESDPPLQQYQDMLWFIAGYAMPPMVMPRNKSGEPVGNGGQLIKTMMAMNLIDGNLDKDNMPKNTLKSSIFSWAGINTAPLTAETAKRKVYFKGIEAKRVRGRLKKLLDDPNISKEYRKKLVDEYRSHMKDLLATRKEYQEAYRRVRDVL